MPGLPGIGIVIDLLRLKTPHEAPLSEQGDRRVTDARNKVKSPFMTATRRVGVGKRRMTFSRSK
jgi:hypothetical protein